jgi:hypothetical protein
VLDFTLVATELLSQTSRSEPARAMRASTSSNAKRRQTSCGASLRWQAESR